MRCLLPAIVALSLAGCATAPPTQPSNICHIFQEKSGWYDAAKSSHKRWGAPIPLSMAIIYQESGYRADAVPPRNRLLWVIPWTRVSSAYGYTQALDSTWKQYEQQSGNGWASRKNFSDSIDFVGWYIHRSYRILGLSKTDAYSQYLAYHEGQGGFRRGSYRGKPGLQRIARRVASRAVNYRHQLNGCRAELEANTGWWPFW